MIRIVQIAPFIGRSTGVAGVAWNLERELRTLGATVERFTFAEARRGGVGPLPRRRVSARLMKAWRVVWFSTVGTARARRFLAARPDAVSICHNDALVGDVYVNHGILLASMRERGHALWRMLRNPAHLFTVVRDAHRFRDGTHRAVVSLTSSESDLLRRTYGRVRSRLVVIPNGVDLARFHRPNPAERQAARAVFDLDEDARVALFIGYEFARKGLGLVIEGLTQAPSVLLLVVGGDSDSIRSATAVAARLGVADRVLFVGPQPDVVPFLHASDLFVLPSSYESSGLVFLEALACGLPVVATRVGVAADIVRDGDNGFLVPPDPSVIGEHMNDFGAVDLDPWRRRARSSVEDLGWRDVAERYLELAREIIADRHAAEAGASG